MAGWTPGRLSPAGGCCTRVNHRGKPIPLVPAPWIGGRADAQQGGLARGGREVVERGWFRASWAWTILGML